MRTARTCKWPRRAILGALSFLAAPAAHAQHWVPLGPAPHAEGYKVPPSYVSENVSGHVNALAWSADMDGSGAPALTVGGGTNWEDRALVPPWPSGRLVSAMAVAASRVQTVYLSLGGFGGGDVWRSSDGGFTWDDFSGDLPDVPVNALVLDESGRFPTVYAGTDVGVWVSTNDGAHWESCGTGLPDARVNALALDRETGRLAAALYGRGVWLAPLTTGDVNNDQRVNLADAVEILRIAGGLREADAGEVLRGDTAPDGIRTMADAINVAQSIPIGGPPPASSALSLP
jgi:hypothetical protein